MQSAWETPKPTIEEQILYQASLDYLFDRYDKVALFGETELTEKILSVAGPHQKGKIQCILTENPVLQEIQNIPVLSTETKPKGINLLIVCADKNEKECMEKARAWAGKSTSLFAAVTDSILLLAARTPKNKSTRKWPAKMYILCSGERTGSTMLSLLLRKTRVLGTPAEQFRIFFKQQVNRGIITYDDIVPEIFKKFQTPNGVFGVKIHGYQYPIFEEAISSLQERNKVEIDNLLNDASYVFLIRNNLYRQAISLWRAQKTALYHVFSREPLKRLTKDMKRGRVREMSDLMKKALRRERRKEPSYKYDELRKSLLQIIMERDTWNCFFNKGNIRPLVITYETFISEIAATVTKIASHVGISLPIGMALLKPPTKKMADGYSEEILQEFQRDIRKIDPQLIEDVESFEKAIKVRN